MAIGGNNLGIFLGAVADQRTTNRQLGLREQGLQLEQDKLKRQQQQDLLNQAKTNFEDLIAIGEFVKTNAPEITPQLEETLRSLRSQIVQTGELLAAMPGGPALVQNSLTQFDAKTSAALTQMQKAEAEAQADVAGARTVAEEAGVPERAALEGAGLVSAETQPPAAQVINFRMPDGSMRAVDARNARAVQDAINAGGVRVSLGVQAQNVSGLDATTRQTPEDISATRESIQTLQANMEDIENSLAEFAEHPEAGGLLGTVIDNAGGVLQQLDNIVGTDIAGTLGMDPAEVRAIRSRARAVVGRMISSITGEQSGRFTERERQIAEQTLAALDPTASAEQIQAAGNAVLSIMQDSLNRELNRLMIAAQADISTEEGRNTFADVLRQNGFTEDQIVDAIFNLMQRLGLRPE